MNQMYDGADECLSDTRAAVHRLSCLSDAEDDPAVLIMIPFKKIPYSVGSAMRLHIYVVGYPCEGESILTVVAQGDDPLLAIVTDCYSDTDGYNHISEILKNRWKNHSVDAFIWTHPHADHSKGIIPFIEAHDSNHEGHVIVATNVVGLNKYPDIWSGALPAQRHLLKN